MKPRNRIFVMMGVLFVIALCAYYFTTSHEKGLELVGTVDAYEAIVSSRIQGRIQSLTVQEGDRVQAGQLLATIQANDLSAARNAAEAAANSSRHRCHSPPPSSACWNSS